ncbi:MAG: 6-phosphogluconolactonase [Planctomycetota bacterium]
MRICKSSEEIDHLLLEELHAVARNKPDALISIATGQTYATFLQRLSKESLPDSLRFTHPDEFLGISHDHPGSMVAELIGHCSHLQKAMVDGRFLPVPASGEGADLADFERKIEDMGGVDLQFLGIGRNGHIAFNEPGTRFLAGYHRTPLAESTIQDLGQRFSPEKPPDHAVTAGPRNILAARRIVIVAKGSAKSEAVRLMMTSNIDEDVPASLLRRHDNAQALVDAEAASALQGKLGASQ